MSVDLVADGGWGVGSDNKAHFLSLEGIGTIFGAIFSPPGARNKRVRNPLSHIDFPTSSGDMLRSS